MTSGIERIREAQRQLAAEIAAMEAGQTFGRMKAGATVRLHARPDVTFRVLDQASLKAAHGIANAYSPELRARVHIPPHTAVAEVVTEAPE